MELHRGLNPDVHKYSCVQGLQIIPISFKSSNPHDRCISLRRQLQLLKKRKKKQSDKQGPYNLFVKKQKQKGIISCLIVHQNRLDLGSNESHQIQSLRTNLLRSS